MLRSLYAKLAAVLMALFVAIGVGFVGVTVLSTDMYRQEITQKLNRRIADDIVAERLLIQQGRIDREALDGIFHMLMVINPGIEVYLLSPEGRILAYSAKPEKVVRRSVSLEPIRAWLDGEPMLPLQGDDPRSPTGKKIFSAASIREGGRLAGYLYVILGGEAYDTVVQKLKGSHILQLSAWIIGAGLVFAFAAGLLLFGRITGRLRRLTREVATFHGGPPDDAGQAADGGAAPARVDAVDEIDRLQQTFRDMARRIQDQVEALRQMDRLRRELVANVSHDLRTPLATLQGYVETLLIKDADLSADERRDYLRIAVGHCTRLNKLVAELFELARLDSQERVLRQEPFRPGELVQDVVQKFELEARQKGIAVETDLGTELPFVRADLALIERVLENLIENALRHTPAGGTVRVLLSPGDGTVTVEVSDTGPGIADEELPRIFDRFYRPAADGADAGGHAGLGLAISRRILELHDRSIEVRSRPGAGATFSFRLPVHQPA